MPKKISWAALQELPAKERLERVTDALRQAKAQRGGLFDEDGTLLVSPRDTFAALFTGEVPAEDARRLMQLLQRHEVIVSNGQRGRSGATRRLVEELPLVETSSGAQPETTESEEPTDTRAVVRLRLALREQRKAITSEMTRLEVTLAEVEYTLAALEALGDDMRDDTLEGVLRRLNTAL